MKSGTLYLIPVNLTEPFDPAAVLPATALRHLAALDYFVVEQAKTARQFLKRAGTAKPLQALELRELNEHTPTADLEGLLAPVLAGRDGGLLSEAGAPAVADPGANLVALAHRRGVKVVPLIGPSALLLALMASGLNGQRFAFLGYLPTERAERIKAIHALEQDSARHLQTQICIETPYRNQVLLTDLLANCRPDTRLCIACHLTAPDELIVTRDIAAWKVAELPDLKRRPTVFLLLAAGARK